MIAASPPTAAPTIRRLIAAAGWESEQTLDPADEQRMWAGHAALDEVVRVGGEVYGITSGFGPLASYRADPSRRDHAESLTAHLAVGQGRPLSPDVTRLMLWLRLEGMKSGHSGVAPDFWSRLAELWNLGFTPVVPSEGSVSASGDLIPLAHAARAFAGAAEAWQRNGTSFEPISARRALQLLGRAPIRWRAREALAFVNGTSASLATACLNHLELETMARAEAAVSGRLARVVGARHEPYSLALAAARGHSGQRVASGWIRRELGPYESPEAQLQAPYSLRCAPQILGAVIDQLGAQERLLLADARGCSDNPVITDGNVLHGGNFHAALVGLCSDQHGLCLHQLAFLAERQLALLVDPRLNGGLPPLLAPEPGTSSGLAGVQLAATSFVSRIRQLVTPSSTTALPTNLWNQDDVPMALNGALAVADAIRLAWLVLGSLALALRQATALRTLADRAEPWSGLEDAVEPVRIDRPLAADVRRARDVLRAWAARELAAGASNALCEWDAR